MMDFAYKAIWFKERYDKNALMGSIQKERDQRKL